MKSNDFNKQQENYKQRKNMLVTIIVGVVALAGGFVFGVLFGRKNIATVNAAVAAANSEIATLKADVSSLKTVAKATVPTPTAKTETTGSK